jgi:hypothetical protein
MDATAIAIYVTQIPIAIGIFIGAYYLYQCSRELTEILRKLSRK